MLLESSTFYNFWFEFVTLYIYSTRIYNLSSGPHNTRFSAVVAKKRKNVEYCKSLFWNEGTQLVDSRWQQQSYFTSTSSNFSIVYFQIGIVLQLKYYQ